MMDRNEAIKAIKSGLRCRCPGDMAFPGPWSVTGGRGTVYGWITIHVAPRYRINGYMSLPDRETLAKLMDLDLLDVHEQGLMVPPERRDEMVCRARAGKGWRFGMEGIG